jgi:hypothetical protein
MCLRQDMPDTFIIPLFIILPYLQMTVTIIMNFLESALYSLRVTCFGADSFLNINYNVIFKLLLHREVCISLLTYRS